MDKIKLVAILRGIQPAEAADHIETLINAGFRYIEIPLNSPDWQQSIPAMVRQFGERAMIGAGTVLKVEQVDFLAEAGHSALERRHKLEMLYPAHDYPRHPLRRNHAADDPLLHAGDHPL